MKRFLRHPGAGRSERLLVLAVLGPALYLALPHGGRLQGLVYLGSCLLAFGMVVAPSTRRRMGTATWWRLLAVGVSMFTAANVVWYGAPVFLDVTLPFPSPVDLLFIGAYVFLVLGLVSLIRTRTRHAGRLGALIDTAIMVVGAGALAWEYELSPIVRSSNMAVLARVVAVTYPLFDLALLALIVRMSVGRGSRPAPFWILLGYVVAQLVGDGGYAVSSLRGSFSFGHPSIAVYVASYFLLAAAAAHPRACEIAEPQTPAYDPLTSRARLWCVGLVAVLTPLMLLWQDDGTATDELVVSIVLGVLAVARMAVLVQDLRDNARSLERRERELRLIVARLNRSEDALVHQALHDPLTALPNRTLFDSRLELALGTSAPEVAVMVLDIDGFKAVNDSLGHAAGDAFLVAIASRLVRAVRSSDTVARFGGDEFTVLADGVDEVTARDLAVRLLRSLEEPVHLDGRLLFARISVGVAIAHEGQTAPELLQAADVAMYAAKRKGGHRFEVFEREMHEQMVDRLAFEFDLRTAKLGRDIVLHYQPIVDLVDGNLRGFEALLRWHHPERGLVPPNEFIPVAEKTGAILPIGRWVIDEACRQAVAWREEDPLDRPLAMNVNVSARQLDDDALVADVARSLAASGLAPHLLTLEITETMLVSDEQAACERLTRLRALGVRISVDDFGTGYATLGYLDRFPIDELKVDRSFVAGLGGSSPRSNIALAAIRLAHSLDIDVIAEGIERREQLVALRGSACTKGQGFYFSKPLPASEAEELIVHPSVLMVPMA